MTETEEAGPRGRGSAVSGLSSALIGRSVVLYPSGDEDYVGKMATADQDEHDEV